MRRRDVLTASSGAVTAAFGGCAALESLSRKRGRPNVSLVDQRSTPESLDLRATVGNDTYSERRPATLEVTMDVGDEAKRMTVGGTRCGPFGRYRGEPEDGDGLWLYPSSRADGLSRDGNRWTEDRSPDERRVWAAISCGWHPYSAGETVTWTYEVWDDYRVDGYLPPGRYGWTQDITVNVLFDRTFEFQWGIDLELTYD